MSEAQRFPELRALQSVFWRLMVAPEGVAAGARALRAEGAIGSEDLGFLVRADDRMNPRERLDVYADMYFYRLRDCLAEDFPKLSAWIGPARLHNVVTYYLLAHPPAHFSLRELGRRLPGFVAGHALASEFPGLADLAALEWARGDVVAEAHQQSIRPANLEQDVDNRVECTNLMKMHLIRWQPVNFTLSDGKCFKHRQSSRLYSVGK